MPSEEDSRVVDLNRYRRAAAERTRSRARPQVRRSGGAERPQLLGRNRLALPILVGVLVLAAVLIFGPALIH